MHNLLVPMQFSHRHSCIWIDFEPFQMQASTQKHSKNALSNAFLVSCTCVSLHNLAHFLASVKRFCCKEMNRATQTPFQTPCQTEKCMQSASKPREPACRTCPFCGSQLCNLVSSKLYQIVFHLNWRMHLSGSKTGFSLSKLQKCCTHFSPPCTSNGELLHLQSLQLESRVDFWNDPSRKIQQKFPSKLKNCCTYFRFTCILISELLHFHSLQLEKQMHFQGPQQELSFQKCRTVPDLFSPDAHINACSLSDTRASTRAYARVLRLIVQQQWCSQLKTVSSKCNFTRAALHF